MGLESLDEFSPKDTDPVSLGDDAIRATRAATKQSVGVEHFLDGPHKIPQGTTAARPAAGRAGRMYFNTDIRAMQFDTGSQWVGYTNRLAPSCTLWHSGLITVPYQATRWEVPFDSVIYDPMGYASTQYHQIVAPVNAVGLVHTYFDFTKDQGADTFGLFLYIEQWDGSNWQILMSDWMAPPHGVFASCTTIVDAAFGRNLRVTITNGCSVAMKNSTWGGTGFQPRFSYELFGLRS